MPVTERGVLHQKYANAIMTVAAHTRRLRISQKFSECCSSLSTWQTDKLAALRNVLLENKDDDSSELGPRTTKRRRTRKTRRTRARWARRTRTKKKKDKDIDKDKDKKKKKDKTTESDDEKHRVATMELMEMEIPATQSCSEAGSEADLRKEAAAAVPVPGRKRTINEQMKETKGQKKKEKEEDAKKKVKPMKKPTTTKASPPADPDLTKMKLVLMPYNQCGRVAIRIQSGRQLLQISKYTPKKDRDVATKLKK